MKGRFEHLTDREVKTVDEAFGKANKEIGLMLVNELRELNINLYKIAEILEYGTSTPRAEVKDSEE